MSAVTVWVDAEGTLRARVHEHDESADEMAEWLAETDGLAVLVVYDYEVSEGRGGDGGRD